MSVFVPFSPDSMMWKINREQVVLLGGASAAVLQVAHPQVAMGVAAHSKFRSDSTGRLRRTLDSVYTVAFGTAEEVERTIGSYRGVLSHCECMALKHKLNQTYGKFYIIKKERSEQNNGNQSIFLCEGREQGAEQELPRLGVQVQGRERPDLY